MGFLGCLSEAVEPIEIVTKLCIVGLDGVGKWWVAWAGTSPRPSPWKGEGGLLGAMMAAARDGKFIHPTSNLSPLLGKERVRVRF
jgi:hypothetical protein